MLCPAVCDMVPYGTVALPSGSLTDCITTWQIVIDFTFFCSILFYFVSSYFILILPSRFCFQFAISKGIDSLFWQRLQIARCRRQESPRLSARYDMVILSLTLRHASSEKLSQVDMLYMLQFALSCCLPQGIQFLQCGRFPVCLGTVQCLQQLSLPA